ncbi:HAMP domain-containing histidine kinase [Sulfurimonas sp.]|nr:HAMP domain-containing histidine kinase [Sulfurimonas sp.]
MKKNVFFENLAIKISSCSIWTISLIMTFMVTVGSVPSVYIISKLADVEYTSFLVIISIVLPALLTPAVSVVLIKLSKHLKHFKDALDDEIEKSQKKDIMLFEQARFALMGEMIANISHQWKQPLNTIGLSVVAMRTSNTVTPECDMKFDIIEDNISYLSSTINDFLSFFDERKHLESRSLDEIIKEVRSIIQGHIDNYGIALTVDIVGIPHKILIASSISQVILNLLNNAKDAFDASSTNKKISLVFDVKDNALDILCYDNGTGIKDDIKDKIFAPYFTTKAKTQGTGIGLYMSKEIMQKVFNGTLEFRSMKKKNNEFSTCFYISIPYAENCSFKKI